jgi:hypothetical protein
MEMEDDVHLARIGDRNGEKCVVENYHFFRVFIARTKVPLGDAILPIPLLPSGIGSINYPRRYRKARVQNDAETFSFLSEYKRIISTR